MWEFPSIQAFFNNSFGLFILTLAMLIGTTVFWSKFYFSITGKTKESDKEFVKNIGGGIITFVILLFAFWGLVSKYREMANCRNLDLTKVTAVRVKKMTNENTFSSKSIMFGDSNKIQEGLKLLKISYPRNRNKDHFVNGCQLQLVLENEPSEFYLEYFPETNKGKQNDVVILRCNVGSNGFNSDGVGLFSSTTFGDWIRENIEPQFKTAQ